MTKVLEFDNIHRAYTQGAEVLAGVGFSVDSGEVVGLLDDNPALHGTAIDGVPVLGGSIDVERLATRTATGRIGPAALRQLGTALAAVGKLRAAAAPVATTASSQSRPSFSTSRRDKPTT